LTEFHSNDLPEFRAWREALEPPGDAVSFVAQHVSVTAAYLLAEVFFPELVEVHGCILLAKSYEPANFEDWWERSDGDCAAVERALNHLHLWDIFEPEGDAEERALGKLAQRVALAWRCNAEENFPDRTFVVEVTDEYGPTVVMSS